MTSRDHDQIQSLSLTGSQPRSNTGTGTHTRSIESSPRTSSDDINSHAEEPNLVRDILLLCEKKKSDRIESRTEHDLSTLGHKLRAAGRKRNNVRGERLKSVPLQFATHGAHFVVRTNFHHSVLWQLNVVSSTNKFVRIMNKFVRKESSRV